MRTFYISSCRRIILKMFCNPCLVGDRLIVKQERGAVNVKNNLELNISRVDVCKQNLKDALKRAKGESEFIVIKRGSPCTCAPILRGMVKQNVVPPPPSFKG